MFTPSTDNPMRPSDDTWYGLAAASMVGSGMVWLMHVVGPEAEVSGPRRGHELLMIVPANLPVVVLKVRERLTKLPTVLQVPLVPQLVAESVVVDDVLGGIKAVV